LKIISEAVSSYRKRTENSGKCGHVLRDRVLLHDDGGVELIGRSDRIIKCAGKRVDLDIIERVIRSVLPNVQVHALFNPERDKIHMISNMENQNKLIKIISDKFPEICRRIQTMYLKELPCTPRGKIDSRKIKSIVKIA